MGLFFGCPQFHCGPTPRLRRLGRRTSEKRVYSDLYIFILPWTPSERERERERENWLAPRGWRLGLLIYGTLGDDFLTEGGDENLSSRPTANGKPIINRLLTASPTWAHRQQQRRRPAGIIFASAFVSTTPATRPDRSGSGSGRRDGEENGTKAISSTLVYPTAFCRFK